MKTFQQISKELVEAKLKLPSGHKELKRSMEKAGSKKFEIVYSQKGRNVHVHIDGMDTGETYKDLKTAEKEMKNYYKWEKISHLKNLRSYSMKLISEFNDYEVSPVIVEQNEKGEKEYFIEGIFMQSEIKNRNGRVYPKDIMEKEVNRYREQFIDKKRAFGELGHPEGPTINLDRVSHLITSLEEDNNNYVGRAKILSTPNGQIVRNLINDDAKLGVSSRGLGSLEQKGGAQYVKGDFQLATAADIVADPSAPEAFVEGIMEGVEWIYENGILKAQTIEKMRQELSETRSKNLQEKKLELWKRFVETL